MKKLKTTASNFLFAFRYIYQSSPAIFVVFFLLAMIMVSLEFFMLMIVRNIINELQNIVSFKGGTNLNNLWNLIILLIAVSVSISILAQVKNLLEFRQKLKYNVFIEKQMMIKNMKLDVSCFDDVNYYNKVELANKNKFFISALYYRVVFFLGFLLSMILNVSYVIWAQKWYYVVIIFAGCIPSFISTILYKKKKIDYEIENQGMIRKTGYYSWTIYSTQAAKEIRFFNLSEFFVGKYKKVMNEYVTGEQKIFKKYGIIDSLLNVLPMIGTYVVVFFIFYDTVYNHKLIGDFIFYLGIYNSIKGKFVAMVVDLSKMKELEFGITKFREYMNMDSLIQDTGDLELKEIQTIEFRNVSFSYPHSDKVVLDDISFIIDAKKKTAMVGINGAGKSTIVKLMLRFYDASSGQILINGNDIKEYNLTSLKQKYAVVLQDFFIYSLSIRDNVALSRIEAADQNQEIIHALEYTDFKHPQFQNVEDLNLDLSKMFCDDGIELSGGQRQKIAIARCIFSGANTVVMDEPTASLDPIAEAKMIEDFSKMYQSKGLILISHRLSNTVQMDNILVIENGKMIESGTHGELMANKRRYYELFNYQASKYSEKVGSI